MSTMSNATAAEAQALLDAAASCADHTAWVAFWTSPDHRTGFVAARLAASRYGRELIAESAAGDWMSSAVLADEVVGLTRMQALPEAELAAREAQWAAEDGWNSAEGKFEVYYLESAYEDLAHAAALREYRAHAAAEAAWSVTPDAHLTHRPFAALAAR